ncbi:hypothetical protein HPP92_016305 [Vanilla planifolia]|uniref:Uncharacterized protein n=1 Tax=Vanilla planifolia TaxID=51239 RepID=A0A835QFE1_VANPL|nr:hypothetical protein HPP92_016305 [Vanilla planifolia]
MASSSTFFMEMASDNRGVAPVANDLYLPAIFLLLSRFEQTVRSGAAAPSFVVARFSAFRGKQEC